MTTLGSLQQITDHVAQARDKLINQYKDKPRFEALQASYVRQLQDVEDCAWSIIEAFFLDTADEPRLEILGRIVGQPRRGETLATYRLLVGARIKVNRSDGQSADIIEIAQLLLPAIALEYQEYQPAAFQLRALSVLAADPDPVRVASMLREAKGGGIGYAFLWPTTATPFTFATSTSAPEVSATLGWGWIPSNSTGGDLSMVIQ